MLKQKTLLPPEERILDVGWTNDGTLVLCFKYFETPDKYDGYFPFSFFDPPLVTLEELENEIIKHFGMDWLPPNNLENTPGIDILKRIFINEFEYTTG